MARKIAKSGIPTEAQEQTKLATWLRKQGIRFTASANGGSRNLLEAMALKRSGVSPGFPDIFIPVISGSWHGMFIEMKRSDGGVISVYQSEWLKYLQEQGYHAVVANGFDHAKLLVEYYMSRSDSNV
jgi:hypothetical protein